jgi:2',3'-cyclic-nucleotide 2'-phosphodiesterase (5'-nucleotidase family)
MVERMLKNTKYKALISVFLGWVIACSAYAEGAKINIIYFSNMPEVFETDDRPGLARVAAYINEARSKNHNQFVIHGGDSLSPAVLSSLDRGAHMIDVLNTVEPDVMAIAKREFAYGEDILIQRAEEALFPFVSSNTLDKRTNAPFDSIPKREIFSVNGVSVGIVALTSTAVISDYAAKQTIIENPYQSAMQQAVSLKSEGADIVILTADFDVAMYDEMFSSGAFDLIIQASFEEFTSRKVDKAFYVRSVSDGRKILDITLSMGKDGDSYRIDGVETIKPDLSQYQPDPVVASAISLHLSPLKALLNTPIGVVGENLTTDRNQVRSLENAFANMLADSLRQRVGADAALVNGGSVRGDRSYKAGYKLTRRDMQTELPFRNTIALLEVSGQQIWDAIEYAIPCRNDFDGCFPQVSNLTIKYSMPQNRLISVNIAGEPLDKTKLYKLATTDYLAAGGDGYDMFVSARKLDILGEGQLTREILSQYIIDNGTVKPKIEDRIVIEP